MVYAWQTKVWSAFVVRRSAYKTVVGWLFHAMEMFIVSIGMLKRLNRLYPFFFPAWLALAKDGTQDRDKRL
jgi:hypothetical protein